jgi:hypothetical protein
MNSGTVHTMHVAFGGYFVNGDAHPRQRSEAPIHASLLGRVRPSFGRDRGPAPTAGSDPAIRFTPTTPGIVRVRAEMWVYALPPRIPAQFTWNEDGTPIVQQQPLWLERLELEHEIAVRP